MTCAGDLDGLKVERRRGYREIVRSVQSHVARQFLETRRRQGRA